MKKQLSVMIALSVFLSACGDDSGTPNHGDPEPDHKQYTPVYDLSKIPKNCADLNNAVVDTDLAGVMVPLNTTLYTYPSVGDQIGNHCSPEGTDVNLFLMSDNLEAVILYSQDIGNVSYEYYYAPWLGNSPDAVGAPNSIPKDITPRYALITDDKNDSEVTINMADKTKVVNKGGVETTFEDYTQEDFLKEYPNQMHHETALNLFKLSSNS